MIPTIIIATTYPNKEDLAHLTRHHPDTPELDMHVFGQDSPINIDEVRSLPGLVSKSPSRADYITIFLLNLQNASLPAQNALLKIIEEHPEYVRFILHTTQKQSVLDTIYSRSLIHAPTNTKVTTNTIDLNAIYHDIKGITKRPEALEYVQNTIDTIRALSKQNHNSRQTNILVAAITAYNQLKANTHVGLTLHNLALSIKPI